MNGPLSIKAKLEPRGNRGRPPLSEGLTGAVPPRTGRIPRVTKLLALAHRFEQLLRDGVVKDYAELARLGQVTRARIMQIMNLMNLAPEIQEEILLMPPVFRGRDRMTERQLRRIALETNWTPQAKRFPTP